MGGGRGSYKRERGKAKGEGRDELVRGRGRGGRGQRREGTKEGGMEGMKEGGMEGTKEGQGLEGGHLTNQDTLAGPKGDQIRLVSRVTRSEVLCVVNAVYTGHFSISTYSVITCSFTDW